MTHPLTFDEVELEIDMVTEAVYIRGINISHLLDKGVHARIVEQAEGEIDDDARETEPDFDGMYERRFDK